jgi:TPR repeat protein
MICAFDHFSCYVVDNMTDQLFDSHLIVCCQYRQGKGTARSTTAALTYFNAAKGIGPWMGWLRRGFDLFLAGSQASDTVFGSIAVTDHNIFLRSLMCYLYAGELGYEVAQSNAAYVLRVKLSSLMALPTNALSNHARFSSSSSSSSTVMTTASTTTASLSLVMLNRLLLREYAMSSFVHKQSDNFFHLGNCCFNGKCGLTARDYFQAKYFYQLAAQAQNGIANAYLAVMYHFQIGVNENEKLSQRSKHTVRADKYYEMALASPDIDSLSLRTTVSVLHKMLKWTPSSVFSFFNPVQYTVDYVVKTLWIA